MDLPNPITGIPLIGKKTVTVLPFGNNYSCMHALGIITHASI
jgi:hypothetical protein